MHFLDCEGFGGTSETLNNDVNLFIISLLLGTCVVYNSFKELDAKSIQQLSYLLYFPLYSPLHFLINSQCSLKLVNELTLLKMIL